MVPIDFCGDFTSFRHKFLYTVVFSSLTAPELLLVNITTTISPPFQHSKWTFPKTWSLGGARRRKRKAKEETKGATEAQKSQKFRLRHRRERRACARRSNWRLFMYFQYFQKVPHDLQISLCCRVREIKKNLTQTI